MVKKVNTCLFLHKSQNCPKNIHATGSKTAEFILKPFFKISIFKCCLFPGSAGRLTGFVLNSNSSFQLAILFLNLEA